MTTYLCLQGKDGETECNEGSNADRCQHRIDRVATTNNAITYIIYSTVIHVRNYYTMNVKSSKS